MATTYLPGAMRSANPSRRAFIGAASLTIPVAAMAALPNVGNPRREWDCLVAEFHRADAEMKTIGSAHSVAEDAYMAGRKLLGDRPERPRNYYPRPIEEMTVGELADVAPAPHEQARYEADLADWQAKDDALGERTIGDLQDRWDEAVSAQNVAADKLLAYPAPDREALMFKLDLADRAYQGCDFDAKITSQIFADVRRFARGEA